MPAHPERKPTDGEFWFPVTAVNDGVRESHQVPYEHFQHEATTACPCGPFVVHHPTVKVVRHFALDESFYTFEEGQTGPDSGERAPV